MTLLQESAGELFPNEFESVNWRDIWERPLEDGTAFQWSIVAALTRSLVEHGWMCEVPLLNLSHGHELMTLRNEIPVAHLAQAGHSATSDNNIPLEHRFLQSVVPKVTFTKGERTLSLFIEGCPQHVIATGQRYEIRPDILLLPGKMENVRLQGQIVSYKYRYSPDLLLEGALRVGNARILPVIQRQPAQDIPLNVLGVIECSVNKSARVAASQIEGYKAVFEFLDGEGTVLVTGNEIKTADCGPLTQVDLKTADLTELKNSLQKAGEYIRQHHVEPDVA